MCITHVHSIYDVRMSIHNDKVRDIVVQGAGCSAASLGTHCSFIWIVHVCCLHTGVFGNAIFLDTDLRIIIVIVHGSIAIPVSTRDACTYDLPGVSRRRRRASMGADETVVPFLSNY